MERKCHGTTSDVGLDPKEVRAARKVEMEFLDKLHVYDWVARSEVMRT